MPERLVGTITKHAGGAMLAGAEKGRAVLLGSVGYGGEARAFVRPVAERLGFAFAAGAPVVGLACLDGDGDG